MDQNTATIVSAFIGGIFVVVGTVISRSSNSSSSSPSLVAINVTNTSTLSLGRILIHIGAIQITFRIIGAVSGAITGGFIGWAMPSVLSDASTFGRMIYWITFVPDLLGLIIAFTISGAKVPEVYRWKHLFFVAVGSAVLTVGTMYLIAAFMGVSFSTVPQELLVLNTVMPVLQVFVCMGIGGAIANITPS